MKPWQLILFGIFLGVAAGAVILIIAASPRGTPIMLAELPTSSPLQVHISGGVTNPGVYSLPPDSRVSDAVSAAGGLLDTANQNEINLAARLQDGQKLTIPQYSTENNIPDKSGSISIPGNGKININTATLEMLDDLPGIGEGKAQEIITYREKNGWFSTIEDIQNVPGIGPGIFENIKDQISVSP